MVDSSRQAGDDALGLENAGHCIVTTEMMVVGCETLYREAADDVTAIPRCDELVKAVFLAMVGASPSLNALLNRECRL